MLVSWLSIKIQERTSVGKELGVSVIVPFRNEADNLQKLINALQKQNYQNFEVLLVNDHSTDNFKLPELPENFLVIHAPDFKQGKKHAITFGVSHAKGEIIITTDADCEFEENWISTLVSQFTSDEVKIVFGGVRFFESKSIFSKLQQMEFAPVIGVGAALSQVGKPIMCNGANLAYRKDVFEEVNGYEDNLDVPTGDDEFLLYKIKSRYPKGIKFCKSSSCIVTTPACKSLKELYHQRKRWASKWSANNSVLKSSMAILVFLSTIATIAGVCLVFIKPSTLIVSVIIGKIIVDGIFIFSVLKALNRSFNPLVFLLTQLVYPFYVLIIGIAANFGTYKWKGRSY